MLFSELIRRTPVLSKTDTDTEVAHLSFDSRDVDALTLFFCLRGTRIDRHAFATEVYEKGCRAFVSEEALPLPEDAAVAVVPNARQALADISAVLYGAPCEAVFCIGVTGTHGKSTTAWLITRILEREGVRVGYIGKYGAYCNGGWVKTPLVTPESRELHALLSEMRECGVTHAVIEVSAQSITLARVHGIRFPLAVLTGLSYAHVGRGEHKDLSAYLEAKKTLFRNHHVRHVVYPAEDALATSLLADVGAKKITVGRSLSCSVCAHASETYAENGIPYQHFHTVANGEVAAFALPLTGKEHITYALLATAAAKTLSREKNIPPLSLSDVAKALKNPAFPQEFEKFSKKPKKFSKTP